MKTSERGESFASTAVAAHDGPVLVPPSLLLLPKSFADSFAFFPTTRSSMIEPPGSALQAARQTESAIDAVASKNGSRRELERHKTITSTVHQHAMCQRL